MRKTAVLAEVGMLVSIQKDLQGLRACVGQIDPRSRIVAFTDYIELHQGFVLEGIGPPAFSDRIFVVKGSTLDDGQARISFNDMACSHNGNLLQVLWGREETICSALPVFCLQCKKSHVMVRPHRKQKGWRCFGCGQFSHISAVIGGEYRFDFSGVPSAAKA